MNLGRLMAIGDLINFKFQNFIRGYFFRDEYFVINFYEMRFFKGVDEEKNFHASVRQITEDDLGEVKKI